jgi:hypothetical protein
MKMAGFWDAMVMETGSKTETSLISERCNIRKESQLFLRRSSVR